MTISQTPPKTPLETIFGDTVIKNRDSIADLKMLKQELGSYTMEQLASLSKTEGAAIKEFADTLKKEMNSPQDCVDLYVAIQDINTNWASLTGGLALTPQEKQKITDCARAIIVTKMRTDKMELTIDDKSETVSISGSPTKSWVYPNGMDEQQFLTTIDLNTPEAAQKALDDSQHFLHQAQILAAGTTQAVQGLTQQALHGLSINTANQPANPSTGPDGLSQVIRQIPGGKALDDARIDNPAMFWGVAALSLYGIYRGVKKLFGGTSGGEGVAGGGTVLGSTVGGGGGGGNGPANQPQQRGAWNEGWFGLRTKMAQAVQLLIGATIIGGGTYWLGKEGYLGSTVKGLANLAKKGIDDTIAAVVGLGKLGTLPGAAGGGLLPPVTVPGAPPGAPSAPNVLPPVSEIQTYRDRKIGELEGKIDTTPPEINRQFKIIINQLKPGKGGPKEALKALEKNKEALEELAGYDLVKDTLLEMVIIEKNIAAAKQTTTSDIQIAITGKAITIAPQKETGYDDILTELKNKGGITPNMEWDDTGTPPTVKGVESKLTALKTAFTDACLNTATPPAEDKNKKSILEPLWRKMIYDVCMERVRKLGIIDDKDKPVHDQLLVGLDAFLISDDDRGIPIDATTNQINWPPTGEKTPERNNNNEVKRADEIAQIVKSTL